MFTIHRDSHPSLSVAAEILGVEPEDLDSGFGVIPLDPQKGSFCVLGDAGKIAPSWEPDSPYSGPWSSPGMQETEA